jgi:hypothetical protein
VFRPIAWVLSAYMEAEQKTGRLMVLELGKLVLLLGGISLLSPFGLRASAGAVGIAFGAMAIGGVLLVMREGPSPWRLARGFIQPLLACLVMAGAVWGTHAMLVAADVRSLVCVIVEIAAGAVAYIAAALVLCPDTSRDLLGLVKQVLVRR